MNIKFKNLIQQEFVPRKCKVCGNECNKLNYRNTYCCLCLPADYITKPVGEWICEICCERKLKDLRGGNNFKKSSN